MENELLADQNQKNRSGTTKSLWMDIELPDFKPLSSDLSVDVCVVGAGIGGLSTAYQCLVQGLSVAVLDRGAIGGGQSARTTAHLSFALDDGFAELEKLFGIEKTKIAADSHRKAVDHIESICKEHHIDCDFERVDGYLFLPPDGSVKELMEEAEAAKRAFVEVEQVDRAPISSFDTGKALCFPNQGQFHILKYLKGLVQVIEQKGGKLFGTTKVKDCKDGEPCVVTVENGCKVTCRHMVIATNTPINNRFFIHTKQAPYRTYAIAAPVPKGSIKKALYWDTLDPYHYVRLQKHETDENLEWIIIGGEDHKTGQFEDKYPFENLENWARERFPMMQEVAHKWSGQVMEPIDGLAFLGRNPQDKHTYIITGDSGHGMTHTTLGSMLIGDLIAGKPSPWEEVYRPERKNVHSAKEFITENLNVAAQYTKWLAPSSLKSADKIDLGSGAVVQDGLSKKAIYRDKEGNMHCYSAVCPHLGCILAWNDIEKTWDCPCHGSNFSADGKLINGPATSDLTKEALP